MRQDYKGALKYLRLAADQGNANALYNLGYMYENGEGVEQDYAKAVKYYKLATEQGHAEAQFHLAAMYFDGKGVRQGYAEACKWLQLAAAQGNAGAIKVLDMMQEGNLIPTPPPGTAITTILLASAASTQYNNRSGIVMAPMPTVKLGRAAVLLDGETKPISFKLKNLQVA